MFADKRARGGPLFSAPPRNALFPALFLALAGFFFASCSKPATPRNAAQNAAQHAIPPAYPFAADATAVFVTSGTGILPVPATSGPEIFAARYTPAPGALAVRVAALAASSGKAGSPPAILAAVNRFGLLRLELQPRPAAATAPENRGEGAYRLEARPLSTLFAPATVGGLWTLPEGYLLQLYRDPFVRDAIDAAAKGGELYRIDPRGEVSPLPALLPPLYSGGTPPPPRSADGALRPEATETRFEEGFRLFALFHAGNGRWLAEFRADTEQVVRSRHALFADPALGGGEAISRAAFEAELAPRRLIDAPPALRDAALALGPEPLLIHARGEDGLEGFWISLGRPEDACEASAWLARDARRALVIRSDGRAALSQEGRTLTFAAQPPVADARFTGLAVLFVSAAGASDAESGGLALVAWEKTAFPDVELAGFLVLPLPPLN